MKSHLGGKKIPVKSERGETSRGDSEKGGRDWAHTCPRKSPSFRNTGQGYPEQKANCKPIEHRPTEKLLESEGYKAGSWALKGTFQSAFPSPPKKQKNRFKKKRNKAYRRVPEVRITRQGQSWAGSGSGKLAKIQWRRRDKLEGGLRREKRDNG